MRTGFWWGNLRERDHFDDLGVDGRILLKVCSRNRIRSLDWIDLAQNRCK